MRLGIFMHFKKKMVLQSQTCSDRQDWEQFPLNFVYYQDQNVFCVHSSQPSCEVLMIALKGPSYTLICVFMCPQNAGSHGCWAVWCLVPWDVNWCLSMSFNYYPGVCEESLNWLPVQLSCPTQCSSFACAVEHMSHVCGFVHSGEDFWLCMLSKMGSYAAIRANIS